MLRIAHRFFERVHETILCFFLAANVIPGNLGCLVNRERIILQTEVADDDRPAGIKHHFAAGFELAGEFSGKHRLAIALEIHQGHVAIEQRRSDQTGVDAPWWMMWHVRGAIFEVGSFQYTPYHVGGPVDPSPWYDEEEARRLGPGFLPGDLSFGIHIPAGALLDRQSCTESMYSAGRLFDDVFPTQGRRVATCSSWLLDDQLAAYLPAESNIVRFQQMFSLVPGWGDADESVVRFVFRNRGVPPDTAHASTRLQRAVLAHLGGGGHFRCLTGWCDLVRQ